MQKRRARRMLRTPSPYHYPSRSYAHLTGQDELGVELVIHDLVAILLVLVQREELGHDFDLVVGLVQVFDTLRQLGGQQSQICPAWLLRARRGNGEGD